MRLLIVSKTTLNNFRKKNTCNRWRWFLLAHIPLYLNAANLHMISSDFEGSPNSVKECICCNTPVVSTPVGNVPEMIGGIPGAYVTKGFTAEELAEDCNKVLSSNEAFEGRDKLLAKGYGMACVAEKLNQIYNSIL